MLLPEHLSFFLWICQLVILETELVSTNMTTLTICALLPFQSQKYLARVRKEFDFNVSTILLKFNISQLSQSFIPLTPCHSYFFQWDHHSLSVQHETLQPSLPLPSHKIGDHIFSFNSRRGDSFGSSPGKDFYFIFNIHFWLQILFLQNHPWNYELLVSCAISQVPFVPWNQFYKIILPSFFSTVNFILNKTTWLLIF